MLEKKTTTEKKAKKSKDKGSQAVKKAQTPPQPQTTAPQASTTTASAPTNVIQFQAPPTSTSVVVVGGNAGGPALASVPVPAAGAVPVEKLSEEYVGWKAQESTAKKNAERLQKDILGRFSSPEEAIGYKDPFLELGKNNTPDYNHPKLVTLLKEKGVWDIVKVEKADSDKVKSLAITNPDIEAMLKDPDVCPPAPRFNQVKTKKD